MNGANLIFSNRPVYRISRHSLFWAARFFLEYAWYFSISLYTLIVAGEADDYGKGYLAFQPALVRLVIDMALCYTVAYWVLPEFMSQRKYTLSILLVLSLVLMCFVINFYYNWYYYDLSNRAHGSFSDILWWRIMSFINSGPPVVCIAFLAIKMLKNWYVKEQEKLAIIKENAYAELKLLKAQIHPHFLFNTLNNIYSFTLSKHPQAGELVDKLSGMMDYMSSEGEKDMVPVEKEIQLIQDYLDLEKVRYGDRLDLLVDISGDYKNKMIAPLLMIPFAENCFKHGASMMRGKQWVQLKISTNNNRLYFSLSNSKPEMPAVQNGKKGIGLANVQKRLQLIYPGKHLLGIESAGNVYNIHLEIELQDRPDLPGTGNFTDPSETFLYAW